MQLRLENAPLTYFDINMNKLSHATSRIPNKERSDVLAGGLAGKLDAEAESVSAALGGKLAGASIAPPYRSPCNFVSLAAVNS